MCMTQPQGVCYMAERPKHQYYSTHISHLFGGADHLPLLGKLRSNRILVFSPLEQALYLLRPNNKKLQLRQAPLAPHGPLGLPWCRWADWCD